MTHPATPGRPAAATLRAVLAVLVLSTVLAAPVRARQTVTVEQIFATDELSPRGLPELRWTPDGTRFTFLVPNPEGGTDLVAEDARTGARERLIEGPTLIPAGERRPIDIEGYEWSPDQSTLLVYTRSRRVWRDNTEGVYFVYRFDERTLQPVSTAFGYQMFAKFDPTGTRVAFVRENDLFVTDLETGEERRLTDSGSEQIINGTFDWVYEEELGLQDGWRWSPDGTRIAFWQLDQTPVKTFHMIDDLRLYSEPVPLPYPKAGDPNSFARIGVMDVESTEVTWMDTGENPDVYLARMEWAASSDELVIQRLNRAQDRIDVLLADAATGATERLFSEEAEAWVDVDDDLVWVDEGRRFLWTSPRDGYEQLYLYDRDGTVARKLTPGEWDIGSPEGMDAEGHVYFTGHGEGPQETHLYRVPLAGGRVERISDEGGSWSMELAPESGLYLSTHSRAGVPPVHALNGGDGRRIRLLEDNGDLRQRLAELPRTEFFDFETADGVTLNGWMIRPHDFDPARRYPVVMYVYGGPGSRTVTDGWGGTRDLWHRLLAERGFIVASVDNRGTGARGYDFKTATYLELGDLESRDQVEAARWLASLDYVDPSRIAIWGWSYGGFMTLMSMARGGDLFAAGVSVAPVTSWRFYDTIYTERFMLTPRENPEGYDRNAPIHPDNVAGITGELLLAHGTGDDNVHFQNTVQLVAELQRQRKQFDLMIYPNKTHSISGADARVHLYTMMTDFLTERLLERRPTS